MAYVSLQSESCNGAMLSCHLSPTNAGTAHHCLQVQESFQTSMHKHFLSAYGRRWVVLKGIMPSSVRQGLCLQFTCMKCPECILPPDLPTSHSLS